MVLWVQVHDLPVGYMANSVAKRIGDKIGVFVEYDPNNYTGVRKEYM